MGLSEAAMPKYFAIDSALLIKLLYDWRTSLGLPVLPEVVKSSAKSG